jgi:hypothetical protein
MQFRKRFDRLALGVALLMLVSFATPALAFAQGPSGSSPDAPLLPSSVAKHLDIGGQDWYAFSTAGAIGDNTPSHVLITLNAVPDGSATFKVWTAEGLRQLATEDPDHPVNAMGEGTKLEYQDGSRTLDRYGGALVWHNGFRFGGTFYVQVGQTGDTASDYLLTITGDDIWFPANAQAADSEAMSMSEESRQASRALPAVVNPDIPVNIVPGSGMDTAMTPAGQWETIQPGTQQWYAIQLPGARNDEDQSNVEVELAAVPNGGAKFTVWTADRLAKRAASSNPDEDAPPVGAGTVMSFEDGGRIVNRNGGNLFWSGDATVGGTIYLVVETTRSTPAQYMLNYKIVHR